MTKLCREVRFRCANDDCCSAFVAQIEIIRVVVPGLCPDPAIRLPMFNANLGGSRGRPANDDAPVPANDQHPPRAEDASRSG